MTPVDAIVGDGDEDTRLLEAMYRKAERFLRAFPWCPPIERAFLAFGIGKIVAVFLFRFSERIDGEEFLWVVVGDVPSVYFDVVEGESTAKSALAIYCDLMEAWAQAVLSGKPLDDLYPVDAKPSVENARSLLGRVEFLRARILPEITA